MRTLYTKNFRGAGVINTNFGSLVSHSLASKVLGADYATKRRVKKSKYVPKGPSLKYPMEVVLEARRLHEQERLPLYKVHEAILAHGYVVTIGGVRNWCLYITFRHDEPAPNAAPYLPLKPSASE